MMASNEKTLNISLIVKEIQAIQALLAKANSAIDSKFDKQGQEAIKELKIKEREASG